MIFAALELADELGSDAIEEADRRYIHALDAGLDSASGHWRAVCEILKRDKAIKNKLNLSDR